jgi:hypothetical protein
MARTVIIVVVLPLRLLNIPGQGSTGLRPFWVRSRLTSINLTLFPKNVPEMTVCKIGRSAHALCVLHSVGCAPCFKEPGFREYHRPLFRVYAPVRARVHTVSVKKWWLRNR